MTNRCESYEGVLFAEYIRPLETLLRVVSGRDDLFVLGVEIEAVLTLAGETVLPPTAVPKWLPSVQGAVVHVVNRRLCDAVA